MKRLPLLLLLGASCASAGPHRVTDLATGRVYYTKEMRRGRTSGKLYFRDGRTGTEVTITSSKVERITEEDYRQATAAK